MAIEFRNMNQWIASSGLNQLFSAPTGIAIGAQPQTEKKGSAASWITTKTAQIALGAFTAMITAGVGYYTYKYFMGSESLLTGALPNNLGIDPNQHKPTDAPQSLIELSGDVMGPNMELSDERMVPFADAFTPRDGNASLTNQDEPLFQSFKAATPYMNNAWSYTISHVKPISTNNNYAVNIFPDVKHPVQDMDVVIDDDVTMTEDLPQPEEYTHSQELVKPESPMMGLLSTVSGYVIPLLAAFVLGGVAKSAMESKQSTNPTTDSTLPNSLPSPMNTPASIKRPRGASPPPKQESLLKRAFKNKTPGTPRNKIYNSGTPASGLRETHTPTSVESIRSSMKSSADSSPAESSVASSPIAVQNKPVRQYDWKYDFDTKFLDETFDINQNEQLSTFFNQCTDATLEHMRLKTPKAIAALETSIQNTERYLNALDDTHKDNFTKELEFFGNLKSKFEVTKKHTDVKQQYFDTWNLVFNLHLFNSVSLRKLYLGPVVQKDEKKNVIENTDKVLDKFLNEMFETLEESLSETDALFAVHNYILSRAYCGIYDGLHINKEGIEFTSASLEQLYQYAVFFQTQFDLIYTSIECDRTNESANAIGILNAFENVMLEMLEKPPEISFNPLDRFNTATTEQVRDARPGLSTARKPRHIAIDWESSSDASSSASASPSTDEKSSNPPSTSPALTTTTTRRGKPGLAKKLFATPTSQAGTSAFAITNGIVGTSPGGSVESLNDDDDAIENDSDSE